MDGLLATPAGQVRRISTRLTRRDIFDDFKVRWGVNRYRYSISPGLYAVGNPGPDAPVIATANYKLTFDVLRRELAGLDLWVAVLDTKGINVWCAAGKGTFGTGELINRIKKTKLDQVVSHKQIIIPQLGAPGVASHQVAKNTGFKVVFGPVRASDLPKFLANGRQTTDDMRRVKFGLKDRLVLTPMEIVPGLKFFLIPVLLMLLFNGVNNLGVDVNVLKTTLFNLIPYLIAFLLGAFFVPVLLPYLPFRSFALKGLFLGALWALIYVRYNRQFGFADHPFVLVGNILLFLSLSSYLALNFTGSSTFTSLSGTTKETLVALPLAALASLGGLGLLTAYTILNLG